MSLSLVGRAFPPLGSSCKSLPLTPSSCVFRAAGCTSSVTFFRTRCSSSASAPVLLTCVSRANKKSSIRRFYSSSSSSSRQLQRSMASSSSASATNGNAGDMAPPAPSTVSSTANGSALDAVKGSLPGELAEKQYATTNWASPGKSEYNFYSDTATSGTVPMLQSIINATLQDDVFREDTTTSELESFVASLFGKQAGLLVMSGTMGNQLALRSHLRSPPHSMVADVRSHIYTAEAGGVSSLSQAMCYAAYPSGISPTSAALSPYSADSNGIKPNNSTETSTKDKDSSSTPRYYLTLEDIQRVAILDDDIHHCRTRVVALENTIHGIVTPLAECQRIAAWARSHDIIMHLDGARIWEVVASQVARGEHNGDLVTGLRAYAECFDTIQTCFSKGLGAPIGSILVGSAPVISLSRHHRKAIGGGIRAAGVIAAPARVAVEQTFLSGRLAATHALARRLATSWTQGGGKLKLPVETNMVWIDLGSSGVDVEKWRAAVKEEGVSVGDSRIVVHYQICEDAVGRLERAMERVLVGRK